MDAKGRLAEIEELNNDNWFCDNPNGREIKEDIDFLIARVKRLEEALTDITSENTHHGFDSSTFYDLIKAGRQALEGDDE